MTTKLLLFHTEEEKAGKIRAAMKLLGIQVLEAGPQQETVPLGMLIEREDCIPPAKERQNTKMPGKRSNVIGNEGIPEEMAVIAGASEPVLDQILAILRSAGMAGALKAVLTKHNANWNCRQLYVELCAEREAVKRGAKR